VQRPLVSLVDAVVVENGFPLLSGVTLDIAPGTVNVITGPNGAGKTSLLRLLAGLVPLSSGQGTIDGVTLDAAHQRAIRRMVGWLGHDGSFYDDLTVRENLTFAARALNRPLDGLDEAVSRVGLGHRRDTITKQLSAGQRRRLGLAWLLLRRPTLWLLDEPYASLDDEGKEFFDELIAHVVGQGATVVLSAHDPLRSTTLATRNIILRGGRCEEVTS